MKKHLLFSILFIFFIRANGQRNHNLEISLERYKAFNIYKQPNDKILLAQLKYSFNISKKHSVFIAFSKAPLNSILFAAHTRLGDTNNIGKLHSHLIYNFYDLGYSFKFYHSNNQVWGLNAGVSYAKGMDSYLKNLICSPGSPYYHIIQMDYEDRNAHYYGCVVGLSYDYFIPKKIINIGGRISTRYYGKVFPIQIDYGLHMGVNF